MISEGNRQLTLPTGSMRALYSSSLDIVPCADFTELQFLESTSSVHVSDTLPTTTFLHFVCVGCARKTYLREDLPSPECDEMPMSREKKCPRCGGEMREGELFISVTGSSGTQRLSTPFSFPTGSPLGIPAGEVVTGEGPFWRERTGRKKGWLVKREETHTFELSGLRCTECGYIELYAHE